MVDNRRNTLDIGINNSKNYVSELQRLWMNEKISKDLLRFNEDLIDKITTLIDQKEKELKQKQHKKDADIDILELDIERVKFILKDYFRIRLKKVKNFITLR
jgi:hypothetical protein